MEFLKILWRGLRDVYDSFTYNILISIVFWICCSPLIFGYGFLGWGLAFFPIFLLTGVLVPPALVVLFAMTDPRRAVDHMEWDEAFSLMKSAFLRSWKIALISLLPLLMIGWNIRFFFGSGETLEFLVPLWSVMWIFLLVLTFYCFSLAGTHESGWRNAFRGGMFVLVKYPFRAFFLAIFIVVVGTVFFYALLPMIIIGPAMFASITNRYVFDAFEVFVPDPNSPTDERAYERERGINMERSLVDRVLRRGKE